MTNNYCSCSFEDEELDKEKSRRKSEQVAFAEERQLREVREIEDTVRLRAHLNTGFRCHTGLTQVEIEAWDIYEYSGNNRSKKYNPYEVFGGAHHYLMDPFGALNSWHCEREQQQREATELFEQFKASRKVPTSALWTSSSDSSMASELLGHGSLPKNEDLSMISSTPCTTCSTLPRPLQLTAQVFEALASSLTCKICQFLSERFYKAFADQNTSSQGSEKDDTWGNSLPSKMDSTGLAIDPGVQALRLELFRQWIRSCDKERKSCCAPSDSRLPNMVIDVGDRESKVQRLYRPLPGETGRYIALSHRWSKDDNYCTFPCNITNRQVRMESVDMPKRFQDAIFLTREFGVRYLWIDCVCIIQHHKHKTKECLRLHDCQESNDWDTERDMMEEYFGGAYLTIAATMNSHEHSDEGFLQQSSSTFWKEDEEVSVSSLEPIIVDDFHRDVEMAELNKRGWILQERALSRRTLHFTSTQAYWECGHGVRCESLTKLNCERSQFLSDPQFPASVESQYETSRILLFQWLFEIYSESSLTVPTDRPVAISGLIRRLSSAFDTTCQYGLFERYRHRCLLWQRSCDAKRFKRILYPKNADIPSWSWMAYEGEISFLDIPTEQVSWNVDIQFPSNSHESLSHALSAEAHEVQLSDPLGNYNLYLDTVTAQEVDSACLKCIIIGRQKGESSEEQTHYVVLVKAQEPNCFERIGVARLEKRHLNLGKEPVRVQIT